MYDFRFWKCRPNLGEWSQFGDGNVTATYGFSIQGMVGLDLGRNLVDFIGDALGSGSTIFHVVFDSEVIVRSAGVVTSSQ